MSRYSTCPPLVYVGNQASGQNLVESTKLERIIVDSKKAHRKEKKEKRKQKKEKHEKKSHKHSKTDIKQQYHLPTKETVDESEQLEKSGLTEELEEPQKLGYSSDGSQNSKKRKRENSPPAVESLVKAARVAGNPLRIRLIFKKPKEDVPSLPREDLDLVCSTSGKEFKEKVVPQEAIANPIPCLKKPELEDNLPSTSSGGLIDETKKRKKHKTSKEERYNALFDDWTPASICFAAMEDYSKEDDDWLFGSCRTQEKLKPKAPVDEDMKMSLCRSGESCWPKAQFLSEVGIYSLPYAIPF